MSVVIDNIGHAHEDVELPADGPVTGKIHVVWLPHARANVQSGTVTFRGRTFVLGHARFDLIGGEWEFRKENMMVPVRSGSMSGGEAARTFREAVLAACSEALAAAYSEETARLVGRTHTADLIREAEMEETRLLGELSAVRDKLIAYRNQHAHYSTD